LADPPPEPAAVVAEPATVVAVDVDFDFELLQAVKATSAQTAALANANRVMGCAVAHRPECCWLIDALLAKCDDRIDRPATLLQKIHASAPAL
jgi:hypothetical protein